MIARFGFAEFCSGQHDVAQNLLTAKAQRAPSF
jgi:hypothetical protein